MFWAAAMSWPAAVLNSQASLPARERPERLPRLQLLGPDGDELAVLDLLDQHLVLVLVRVALVVGELHRAIDGLPASAVERLARLLAVAVRLCDGLGENPHRRVGGRRVVAGLLPVLVLIGLGELLCSRPGDRRRPLRAGEDAVRHGRFLRE